MSCKYIGKGALPHRLLNVGLFYFFIYGKKPIKNIINYKTN